MNKIESVAREAEKTKTYVQLFIYRVPKQNHNAMVQLNKQIVPWLEKREGRMEFLQLSNNKNMDGWESIAKTLSIGEAEEKEEEVWIELNYYRDQAHANEVYSKMMQDKSIEPLFKQFEGLITQGKSTSTGGFTRLRV
jgi:uncharacterized protein YbaA (DUF1428 family)